MTAFTSTSELSIKPGQPWLASGFYDCLLILSPAFIASILALTLSRSHMFPDSESLESMSTFAWVILVLMVDVAHVYATLFRTYMDPKARASNGTLLSVIPVLCWVGGVLLYAMHPLNFWRALAYLAVFHFIRQQYGFLMLYSRKDNQSKEFRLLDQITIYLATIYPLIYWHAHLPRHFNWFVEGDFWQLPMAQELNKVAFVLYVAALVLYITKEINSTARNKAINIPRNLLIVGTTLSWWVGIVATNCDLLFTMTNVLSHGIPYMALVWLYHRRTGKENESENLSLTQLLLRLAPLFFLFLVTLAYLEEGLWDGFIWHEHLGLFAPFAGLPQIEDKHLLTLLVPFLALPQSTHYVLDGFIWRVKDRTSTWSA